MTALDQPQRLHRQGFFLSHAPWSALAAVGRGASGEKTMSLVRTNDQLYKAKAKHCDSGQILGDVVKGGGWLRCKHAKGAT